VETSLITSINRQKYYTSPYHLREFLNDTLEEGRRLRRKIRRIVACCGRKVDFSNPRETIRFINECILQDNRITGGVLSNSLLIQLSEETGNTFFQFLVGYRKSADRYRKIAAVIQTVVNKTFDPMNPELVKSFLGQWFGGVYIPTYPVFTLNRTGQISMVRPMLPFDREGVKKLFRFNVAVVKDRTFEGEDVTANLIHIKERYHSLMTQFDDDCYCMILGNTLYVKANVNQFETVVRRDIESETLRGVSFA